MGEWQPIETAPKDGKSVLVFVSLPPTSPIYYGSKRKIAQYDDGRYSGAAQWVYTDTDRAVAKYNPPTHWMPLPEPPKE